MQYVVIWRRVTSNFNLAGRISLSVSLSPPPLGLLNFVSSVFQQSCQNVVDGPKGFIFQQRMSPSNIKVPRSPVTKTAFCSILPRSLVGGLQLEPTTFQLFLILIWWSKTSYTKRFATMWSRNLISWILKHQRLVEAWHDHVNHSLIHYRTWPFELSQADLSYHPLRKW